MSTQQLVLSLVLATMVFSVALELQLDDFLRVARSPKAVVVGLVPQFILLPVGTWLATLALDLPANVEAAMILVATNPATAGWLQTLNIDPSDIWISLFALLALPLALGLALTRRLPALSARIRKPLGNFSLVALLAFIVLGLIKERQLLTLGLLPTLGLVVVHNASGLLMGWVTSGVMGLSTADRRAVTIEGGMQNAGLALGIIAVQFNADLGMVIIASLWGIWHIVSGMSLALLWRRIDRLQTQGDSHA